MNRFSELHDDERIVFCKIDHVMEDFRRVATLPHKVVMLIMNGDFSFTPEILKHKPSNVKHIFATNSTVYNNMVTPIPVASLCALPLHVPPIRPLKALAPHSCLLQLHFS
jgi:hypothetical protein